MIRSLAPFLSSSQVSSRLPSRNDPVSSPVGAAPVMSSPMASAPEGSDARGLRLASLAHLGGILLFPPALAIWLFTSVSRRSTESGAAQGGSAQGGSAPGRFAAGRFAEGESKEALNWQITFGLLLVLVGIVVGMLQLVLFFTPVASLGTILNVVPWSLYAMNVVLSVIAFRTARSGQVYRYPLSLRLVK